MKLSEILKGVEPLEVHASLDIEISGVCFDSRAASGGSLFVAVFGFTIDGFDFIDAAFLYGASCVITEKAPKRDVPYVLVSDARKALAITSANFYERPAEKLKIVGITGTNGKTTSALLTKHVLEKTLGVKVGLIGTNGVLIGEETLPSERTTPESLDLQRIFALMVDAGCTHCVMEVSSHSLTLHRVYGVQFAVGLFTNLTQDHLDFHATMDEYAQAKAMLFEQSDAAVINLDADYADLMISKAQKAITISCDNLSADLVAKDIKLEPDYVRFCALKEGLIERVRLPIPGRFSVYNALGVLAAVKHLGVELHDACAALETAHGVKGRLEAVSTGADFTVIIDYAHTPDALENVLCSLRETSKGRLVAVLGCGGDRDKTKRPQMGRIATEKSDFVVFTSDNPRSENPDEIVSEIAAGATKNANFITITDRVQAIKYAIVNHKAGDTILLAGKGHETYQEVKGVRYHMDEREIVRNILEEAGI